MTLTVKSCCCFSLKTGGIIIGAVGILLSFIVIYVFGLIYAHNASVSESRFDSIMNVLKIMPFIGVIVLEVFWIYGILRENPKPMCPKLFVSFFALCILVPLPFASLFYFSITKADPATGSAIFFLLFCLAGLAYYVWIVQYSLFKSIKEAEFAKYCT
ncbi:uncharacterized protein LOC129579962 [Sitodiplosis mosellana]|uniref:uncharacterized protein LOC129579962 n=1 Tax=Sitodiplosis mosellana TaxID=263140 RepID=UPI002444E9AA|nr:uncharacterized protein LOC129579962 [Sitodiplosis mosellana]